MTLVFATHNNDKVKEVQALLPGFIKILTLTDIQCFEDIPETEATIEGNALLKARHVFEKYNYPCFADDTGLEVNALGSKPGVHSSRYAGEDADAEANIQKLLNELKNKEDKTAQFKTVIALVRESGEKLFAGICKGRIISEKKGNSGFGYDPVFVPEGFDLTFAEMTPEEKNAVSHRGKAIRQLTAFLKSQ